MTHRDRMLATVRGEPTDRMPWAPRLDLWYNARKRAGTLPPEYRDADLADITDDLKAGYHAVVPHFKDLRSPEDDVHRALGIYNLWSMPYATELNDVEVDVATVGDETHVEYRTPLGSISTTVIYSEEMKRAGVSITHVSEYAIKSHRDYAPLSYLFDHAQAVPNCGGYDSFRNGVGERGFAVAFLSLAASPMHLLQRELMPMDLFFYELTDHPKKIEDCAEAIGGYFDRVFDAALTCSAEVYLLGANYDASVTYPPFFAERVVPWLRRFSDLAHAQGKFLLTHTDGENSGLLEHYLACGIDIADSVCPRPMTRMGLREVREVFDGRVTIMGGVPSICLLPSSMPDGDFEAYLEGFFTEDDAGDHLILGISDTTPPAAELGRIRRIGEMAEAFGPVGHL